MSLDLMIPDWPAPANVRACFSGRKGGVSLGVYRGLNLGLHVGDDPLAVAQNRALVAGSMPSAPHWLTQVHGIKVVSADAGDQTEADASLARKAGTVCVVMVADCLPVLFCDRAGSVVAAAHAGWRGLADGVLEATVSAMGIAPQDVLAWMGPAIGPAAFEVGPEVRACFVRQMAAAERAFQPGTGDRWFADIFLLARLRLEAFGLPPAAISGGGVSTVADSECFYSYRRDGLTGRMGAFIWMDRPAA